MGFRRVGILATGLAIGLLGVAYAKLAELNPGAVVPALWSLLFAGAAGLVVGFAFWPNRRLWRIAGPLVVAGLWSIPFGSAANLLLGHGGPGGWWLFVVEVIVYPTGGWFLWEWWRRDVGPWQIRQETDLTVQGD